VFGTSFFWLAALACALVGAAAPAVGVFIVQRRLSLIGDGIGHVAFAGAAIGGLLHTTPVATAAIAAVAGGVAIEVLRARGRVESDVALATIFYGGIASGVLLASLSHTPSASIIGFLFGSVLTVTGGEVVTIAVLATAVVVSMWGLRKLLFGVCYDEELARVAGLPVRTLNFVIVGGASATVAVSMRVVGALLIAALMVLPVATAQRLVRSFSGVWRASLAVGVVTSIGGLVLSVIIDAQPAATIVVCGMALMIDGVVIQRVAQQPRNTNLKDAG
jgi:zinc transport system permease protein